MLCLPKVLVVLLLVPGLYMAEEATAKSFTAQELLQIHRANRDKIKSCNFHLEEIRISRYKTEAGEPKVVNAITDHWEVWFPPTNFGRVERQRKLNITRGDGTVKLEENHQKLLNNQELVLFAEDQSGMGKGFRKSSPDDWPDTDAATLDSMTLLSPRLCGFGDSEMPLEDLLTRANQHPELECLISGEGDGLYLITLTAKGQDLKHSATIDTKRGGLVVAMEQWIETQPIARFSCIPQYNATSDIWFPAQWEYKSGLPENLWVRSVG